MTTTWLSYLFWSLTCLNKTSKVNQKPIQKFKPNQRRIKNSDFHQLRDLRRYLNSAFLYVCKFIKLKPSGHIHLMVTTCGSSSDIEQWILSSGTVIFKHCLHNLIDIPIKRCKNTIAQSPQFSFFTKNFRRMHFIAHLLCVVKLSIEYLASKCFKSSFHTANFHFSFTPR